MGADLSESRLVLVSNGEPYKHEFIDDRIEKVKLAGGLTTGLDPLMQEEGGLWIAWGRGDADFEVVDGDNKVKVPDENGYTLKRIRLSSDEQDGFYYGFSNEVMWPICHTFISKANFKEYYWNSYKTVNRKYADSIIEEIKENDLVWIHDYHLALVPGMIKERADQTKISVFWHIPWPAWEAFRTIPWRKEILENLLQSDFIAFHTELFLYNFISCADQIGAEVNYRKQEIKYKCRKTKISSIPLGIDYDKFSKLIDNKNYYKEAEKIKKRYNIEKLIFGVDRLDYTKGIWQRLKGIDKFFEKYPEYRGRVTVLQRVSPSRNKVAEYEKMREKINKKIAEINGKYQKDNWVPVKYFYGSLPQEKLLPYYKAADAALITPLIDGMNLVAKEYLAVQEDGVLILSEFAGAAEYLDNALIVNPYNQEEIADSIYSALTMPKKERKERLKIEKEKLKKYDINWWRDSFLKQWAEVYE
ncbi:trehalose-6-phosphate synthase [Halanaerobium sp. MA284_MarDTE_T2]|uniref:alpha,alpha-trehalose-phosphate synthase (UDP-forming) n=1 Tax=Halanaerobium sp. MA284_MarDTE_T2 TaxID=2183913 RepID=UPI000DF3DE01|nr:trehalose-6-phosphate synthase [Halanaerobium sp. MA284_MarDTE_T2]